MVNESFSIIAFGARACEILFLEPQVGDTVVVGQVEFVVQKLKQAGARKGIGLVNLVANFGQIGPASDQFRAGVKRAGPGGGILKRAGIGGNCRKQAIGNGFGDWPARRL